MWVGLTVSGVVAFIIGIWWFRRGGWWQSVIDTSPPATVPDRAVES
jgi:Na+-driven multidrug efflux pump